MKGRIEPIVELHKGEEAAGVEIAPYQYSYFRYDVAHLTGSFMIHVRATPGPEKIKLFGSAQNMYPDEDDHQWTSGILKSYRSVPEMFAKECFPDFDVFVLDSKNQLVHWPVLSNEPVENRVELDKESVAMKMDNEAWKYIEKVCYVSCKNVSDSPVSFTLKIIGAPPFVLPPRRLHRDRTDGARDGPEICAVHRGIRKGFGRGAEQR